MLPKVREEDAPSDAGGCVSWCPGQMPGPSARRDPLRMGRGACCYGGAGESRHTLPAVPIIAKISIYINIQSRQIYSYKYMHYVNGYIYMNMV